MSTRYPQNENSDIRFAIISLTCIKVSVYNTSIPATYLPLYMYIRTLPIVNKWQNFLEIKILLVQLPRYPQPMYCYRCFYFWHFGKCIKMGVLTATCLQVILMTFWHDKNDICNVLSNLNYKYKYLLKMSNGIFCFINPHKMTRVLKLKAAEGTRGLSI